MSSKKNSGWGFLFFPTLCFHLLILFWFKQKKQNGEVNKILKYHFPHFEKTEKTLFHRMFDKDVILLIS